ncbi:Glycerophosphodiester phosphodiesterase GDE1 [Hordeum vulgare]|nr:Glycerophosphodiester phosphodiesterase GDE1 [Hordeum vulgare]
MAIMPSWIDEVETDDDDMLHFVEEYKIFVVDVNRMVQQQMHKTYQENYKKMMSEDNQGMEKQLDQKQYVIEYMKVIQKEKGELIRNLRCERHELTKDMDINGLNKDMYVLKSELQDQKKDKKRISKEKLEGIKDMYDINKGKEKL